MDDGSRYPEAARHATPQGVHLEEFLRDEMFAPAPEEVTDLRTDPREIRLASSYARGIADTPTIRILLVTRDPEIERSDRTE